MYKNIIKQKGIPIIIKLLIKDVLINLIVVSEKMIMKNPIKKTIILRFE